MERTSYRTPDTKSDTGSPIGQENGHAAEIGHEIGHALEIGHDFGHGHIAPPPKPTNDAEVVRAGHALLAIKCVLRGEFETWVAAHCEFTPRTARRYMDAARASGPFDHEADWLTLPDTLPPLDGFDPPTAAEMRVIANSLDDDLVRSDNGRDLDFGLTGDIAVSMATAAPTITAGQAVDHLRGLAREMELKATKLEGIAAAFARLPADAPLWFTRACQEWHRAQAGECEGSARRLEAFNAGRFGARHLRDRMRRLDWRVVGLLVQEGWNYPPDPPFPRGQADVDEYHRALDEWLSELPDEVASVVELPPPKSP